MTTTEFIGLLLYKYQQLMDLKDYENQLFYMRKSGIDDIKYIKTIIDTGKDPDGYTWTFDPDVMKERLLGFQHSLLETQKYIISTQNEIDKWYKDFLSEISSFVRQYSRAHIQKQIILKSSDIFSSEYAVFFPKFKKLISYTNLLKDLNEEIECTEKALNNTRDEITEMQKNPNATYDNSLEDVVNCQHSIFFDLLALKEKRKELRKKISYWWKEIIIELQDFINKITNFLTKAKSYRKTPYEKIPIHEEPITPLPHK